MKRRCLISILTLLSVMTTSWGYAYTVDEIFQNFKKAYEKSQNFSATFEETTFRSGTKSVAKGRVIFGKPNRLRKEYIGRKDPNYIVQLIVLDGEYSWSYTPMLNQVNKMKWSHSSRQELLPGIGASLEDVQKNYNMKLIPDEAANKKGIYQIELTPKPHMLPKPVDGTLPPREILSIWVKTDQWLPVQFGYKSESDSGNDMSVIVSMSAIRRDQELDAAVFKFVIPEGTEVIDLSPDE
jgi:outer membrane lipoprotein-sorting protein